MSPTTSDSQARYLKLLSRLRVHRRVPSRNRVLSPAVVTGAGAGNSKTVAQLAVGSMVGRGFTPVPMRQLACRFVFPSLLGAAMGFVTCSARAARVCCLDFVDEALSNGAEQRHQVSVRAISNDVAIFTVLREYRALDASQPMAVSGPVELPEFSVITSFDVKTDATWRSARLQPFRQSAPPERGSTNRPWAALAFDDSSITLEIPPFASKTALVRYTIWSQAQLTERGARWDYCYPYDPKPQLIGLGPGLTVRRNDDESADDCFIVEKALPPPTRLTAKYGIYDLGDAWLWRIESAWPTFVPASPTPPGPFVFVLDTSKSQRTNGGLATQIRIVKALLSGLSRQLVEFVLVNRSAKRALGRFVPASELAPGWIDRLAETPLANGSFLEHGVELAAEALSSMGKAGEIVVLSDMEMRKRLEPAATVAHLRRAPRGTKVHLVQPSLSKTHDVKVIHVNNGDYRPIEAEGLSEWALRSGGSMLELSVAPQNVVASVSLEQLTSSALLGAATKPETFIAALRAGARSSAYEWPSMSDWSPARGSQSSGSYYTSFRERLFRDSELLVRNNGEVRAGARQAWMGYSLTRPPNKLRLAGQAMGRVLEVELTRDRDFEGKLVRFANSQLAELNCLPGNQHAQRARASGFLAPGLEFWVPGTDPTDGFSMTSPGPGWCEGAEGGWGTAQDMPTSNRAVADMPALLRSCTAAAPVRGSVQISVESRSSEILDVIVTTADAPLRHCLEEALWAIDLPPDFNGYSPETFTWGTDR